MSNFLSVSGFNVARAVEAALEVYYQLFTEKPGPLNGWHDYIQALEAVRATGADPAPAEKALAELRQMEDDYRNPRFASAGHAFGKRCADALRQRRGP